MAEIINLQKAKSISASLRQKRKPIVLVGGCFDILHIGHIKFLGQAKRLGDILIVLLESDANVKKLKGKNRPIFTQIERAQVLSALSTVDYVVLLSLMNNDREYKDLVLQLKPNIIAVTENDPFWIKKKSQADLVKGKIEIVTYTKTLSSSKLAKILGVE